MNIYSYIQSLFGSSEILPDREAAYKATTRDSIGKRITPNNVTAEHVQEVVNKYFPLDVLEMNSYQDRHLPGERVITFIRENGFKFFEKGLNIAPDLYLQSPSAFITALEIFKDHRTNNQEAITPEEVHQVITSINQSMQEHFNAGLLRLSNFQAHASEKMDKDGVYAKKIELAEIKKIFNLKPLSLDLLAVDRIFDTIKADIPTFSKHELSNSQKQLKSLFDKKVRTLETPAPSILDPFLKTHKTQGFLALCNQVCREKLQMHQNPEGFVNNLSGLLGLAYASIDLAKKNPPNLKAILENDFYNLGYRDNYIKKSLINLVSCFGHEKIQKFLFLDDKLDVVKLRSIVIANHALSLPKSSYFLKNRSRFYGNLSFYINENTINEPTSAKNILFTSKTIGRGTMKHVNGTDDLLSEEPLVKAVIRDIDIAATEVEAALLTKLAKRNCKYILSPYRIQTVYPNKNNEAKLLLYGARKDSDGMILLDRPVHQHALVLWQLAQGLQVVHEEGYTYHDLKIENILLSFDQEDNPTAILNDFGLATEIGDREIGGTPLYSPPEYKKGQKQIALPAIDIWGLGAMTMVLGVPYEILDKHEVLYQLQECDSQEAIDALLLKINTLVKDFAEDESIKAMRLELIDEASKQLIFDPDSRPSMKSVIASFEALKNSHNKTKNSR